MKKLLPLFLLIVSVAAYSQKPAKLPKEISEKYDKFNDRTEISLELVAVPPKSGWLSGGGFPNTNIHFEYAGKTLAADVTEFTIVFLDGCSRYSSCFRDSDEVIFLLDDSERLKKGNAIMSGVVDDVIGFNLTRDDLVKLGSAKKVEFKVGNYEALLRPKELPLFKALLEMATAKK